MKFSFMLYAWVYLKGKLNLLWQLLISTVILGFTNWRLWIASSRLGYLAKAARRRLWGSTIGQKPSSKLSWWAAISMHDVVTTYLFSPQLHHATTWINLSSFSLIALAEIGDKSQLVCLTLAARHCHRSGILGGSNSINHTQCAGSLIRCGSRGLSTRKKWQPVW